jgi:formamidopyrimidine-DNA glycosylase
MDDQQRIAGRTIEQVVPVGKHLIIDFSYRPPQQKVP